MILLPSLPQQRSVSHLWSPQSRPSLDFELELCKYAGIVNCVNCVTVWRTACPCTRLLFHSMFGVICKDYWFLYWSSTKSGGFVFNLGLYCVWDCVRSSFSRCPVFWKSPRCQRDQREFLASLAVVTHPFWTGMEELKIWHHQIFTNVSLID